MAKDRDLRIFISDEGRPFSCSNCERNDWIRLDRAKAI